MDGPPRSLYAWTFADAVPVAPTVAGIEIRRVLDDDDGALGRLMERAYAGTIDENLGDDSDGEVEIRDWRDSGGRTDESAVAVRDGAAVSACLITLGASGNWWVAYVFSDPATKALGVGASVVAAAVQRVRAAGAADVRAEVTDGNVPSERLMRRFGFVRMDPTWIVRPASILDPSGRAAADRRPTRGGSPKRRSPMSAFAAVDVIAAKRDRQVLTDAQIDWTIASYTSGEIAEEQMSALLMAILLNGMTAGEIARWTAAMIGSGIRLDLSGVGRPTVDKHSTGGVGDKISLPLAPLVAACGAAVPQLSGRGLGHTGGTLDKMESISGWNAVLSPAQMIRQLSEVGAVICAASADLAPADRKLYALRDVTATVESIPMIAASIMSKKIAEGTDALVLDVKVGSGAFMKSTDQARELARTMVELGAAHGVRASALLTDMSTPLGVAAGNAMEVVESLEVLAGGGPADVVELTLALAREMVDLAGLDVDPARVLASGAAMDSWRSMVVAQGGDPDRALPVPRERHVVSAEAAGIVSRLDAYAVGVASWRLGAGRARKEDPVQAAAGILCLAKPGDEVAAGQPLFELHSDTVERFAPALADLVGACEIASLGTAVERRRLIIDVVRG